MKPLATRTSSLQGLTVYENDHFPIIGAFDFFKLDGAEVTHGAKNGGPFSEMMG